MYRPDSVSWERRDDSREAAKSSRMVVDVKSRWRNRARVTTPSLSRMGPKTGSEARTTTAFWTVERVTSGSLTRRSSAAIWRLHEIPKMVLGLGVEEGTRWK